MHFLLPLAGLLGIEVESLTERFKHAFALYVAMALFGIIGVSFLLTAAFFAIAQQLGPVYAALILSGIFIFLALVVFLLMKAEDGRRRRLAAEKRRTSETSAFVTTAAMTALPAVLRSPTMRVIGIPAAALAAFFLLRNKGDRP
jgi:cobalamin synthase